MSKTALLKQGILAYTLASPRSTDTFSFYLQNKTKVTVKGAGLFLFEPKTTAQRVVILSAGIHGNETAPIECLDVLASQILSEQWLISQPTLIILGNPPAMIEAKRELSVNLNRLFTGQYQQYPVCYEVNRAKQLEQMVADFYQLYPKLTRYHLDLHTAIRASKYPKFAVYPYTHEKAWKLSSLALLQACGVNCVLFSNQAAATFSFHSSFVHGAIAFTVELGKVQPFGENDLSNLADLQCSLIRLMSAEPLDIWNFQAEQAQLFEVSDVIEKTSSEFRFNFSPEQANFSEYPSGYLLARDGVNNIVIEDGPKAIVFPNDKVAIGQRAVLLVKKMSRQSLSRAYVSGKLV
ncbi:succinylglutamate desuccinylase [Agarivorans sp. QJM3NY_25]|uniref:succinylglutamate desuccinylase n=1 Tax=Agarivorans sp. QJM3NY_25 TaxID=3421430 RepID=UPI003D7D9B69